MEKIVSTGTKGGVGKSTFAILLAFKLSKNKKVILCDSDVECPNDYLITGKKLKNPKPIYKDFPLLDKEKCTKCGLCSEACKYNAVFFVKNKYPVFVYDLCSSCRACMIACPEKAIDLKKKSVGESYINKINNNFWLVTGVSKPRVLDIVPAVRETKQRALELAKKENADYLIIDSAPGTHCNVIEALMDSDKAYTVTEPTPLGSHDLGLILELVKKLKIPAEIVLNKSDVGNRKEIEKIAEKFSTKISFEIPYSEELVDAYCNKKLDKMVNLL
jgi:MinD superfamily P-loop ATPase